jgi:hypothetical protein
MRQIKAAKRRRSELHFIHIQNCHPGRSEAKGRDPFLRKTSFFKKRAAGPMGPGPMLRIVRDDNMFL